MYMRTPILTIVLGMALGAAAQNSQGGISPEMLQQIRQQHTPTAADRAVRNAVAANAIDQLARNQANAGAVDTHFSVETLQQSITDQKSSGRCWMFSGLNVLRADFARRTDSLRVSFSHDYLFFWDQLEKANLMLQGIVETGRRPIDDERVRFLLRNPLGDGGTYCGVADLAEKYGLVPAEVQPETYSAENTSRMSALIKSKLREQALELRGMVAGGRKGREIEQRKTEMLGEIYRMLAVALGEPVREFTYAFRNKSGRAVGPARRYTPQTFYDETVGRKLNGTFLMVMNDPRRPYHKTYEVEMDRHLWDGHNWKYLNLPMDEIEQLAIASLRDGRKLYSSYDVGKQLDRKRGYCDTENFDYASLMGTTFRMEKADRIATFDSGSTHAMTLTAVDLDAEGRPLKWKVENSWGADWGQKGCLVMTARWFREYMFRLVVDKQYANEKLLLEYEQQPTIVGPEDPLFMPDE